MRKDFLYWGSRLERWLLRAVVLCAVVLVAVQWFAYDPAVRVISQVDEGLTGGNGTSYAHLEHLVTFQLLDYSTLPKAAIMVNGEKKGCFTHRYVTVAVDDGAVLAIDARFYQQPVSVKVIETYGDVQWPPAGTVFAVHGTVREIGKVVVRGEREKQ